MRAIILGSAAGGGVPQWNCRCRVCELAWAGDPRVRPRTQSSLAASGDGERWVVCNASPDIRRQLDGTPELRPRGLRHSPIAGVVLTNGDVDHVAGLLSLRERHPFRLYATAPTLRGLARNPIFDVVARDLVAREPVALGEPFAPVEGLQVELFAVPGKVPLWLEDGDPDIGIETGSTVGALVSAAGRRIAYIPGCAAVTQRWLDRVRGVDLLLFDGTVWEDDEMIRAGTGGRTGRRMGHMPLSGPDGSIAGLAGLEVGRRVLVHLNNTNPVLIEDSPERAQAAAAGWEIAYDGMRFQW